MSLEFYRAFEDKFRGSRTLIKDRIKVYLPFVEPLKSIYPSAIGFDIGCGRGEWIELLKEHNIPAMGIDLDAGMLEACHELNLDVRLGDGIAYLRELDSDSLIIISAFHVVEHISFEQLQTLVEEALRVLKPGGILILETPNPENIRVGTESFYLDPTHVRPIPSTLLSFLPEFYGYERTKILRLQEDKSLASRENINLLNVMEGVSPDYAVLAQKKADKKVLKEFDAAFLPKIGLELIELTTKFEERLYKIEASAKQAVGQAGQAEHRAGQAEHRAGQAEHRAGQAEHRAGQAEHRAGQAEAIANQLHSELDIVYNSRSWLITKPLRWIILQLQLLKRDGFLTRIKAFVSRLTGSSETISPSTLNNKNIDDLPLRARQVYTNLKQAIDKNEKGK